MDIKDYVGQFTNHPILFVGTGFSMRYIENSFSWDELLEHTAYELKGEESYYLDLKYQYRHLYPKIATSIEEEFDKVLTGNFSERFQDTNKKFYDYIKKDIHVSRFKIYLSSILSDYRIKEEMSKEILELKKIRKNISSIITTNYDTFIEEIFEFNSLIGNEILLSNPYGSVYKIHGCVKHPDKIIITYDDYERFEKRYELIRAQLLSLFIHNPIIFLGYSVSDNNIKKLLKTIFSYVNPNTDEAEKIRNNFLLVEYTKGSQNTTITDHDIDIEGFQTIRINKLKTDNFLALYQELSDLILPISAMDIRKVQSIVQDIYKGNTGIQVSITENIENLKNNEKVLAIGSVNTIKYEYHSTSEIMEKYFKILDESNYQLLELIDKIKIQKSQFFPIYGFSKVNKDLNSIDDLISIQENKITNIIEQQNDFGQEHGTISDILKDDNIATTRKNHAIALGTYYDRLDLNDVETYLRNYENKNSTNYRRLLCFYDYKKHS
ncbi:SIR2 family protein [Jeotgalicoccus huakuii]|nr:SIR2 family protein [Jeotgalicoccus huakuii]